VDGVSSLRSGSYLPEESAQQCVDLGLDEKITAGEMRLIECRGYRMVCDAVSIP
jgi:hypothetical protein